MSTETHFNISFNFEGERITAAVQRFNVKPVRYLVTLPDVSKVDFSQVFIFTGNAETGQLDYPYEKDILCNAMVIEIIKYCLLHDMALL